MPRRARLCPPGLPLHVVHRGHNRGPCFSTWRDRERYLEALSELSGDTHCSIHAFVLMTNHVHLLVTPKDGEGISRMMKGAAQRHAQFMNWKQGKSGSLWQGRFHSSPVDTEAYFLACHRYIELNPVRAGLARHPRDYPWSSYLRNAEGQPTSLVEPHAQYLALGADDETRQLAYRSLFELPLEQRIVDEIRAGALGGFALGTPAFHARLEAQLGVRTRKGSRGRPRASPQATVVDCYKP